MDYIKDKKKYVITEDFDGNVLIEIWRIENKGTYAFEGSLELPKKVLEDYIKDLKGLWIIGDNINGKSMW